MPAAGFKQSSSAVSYSKGPHTTAQEARQCQSVPCLVCSVRVVWHMAHASLSPSSRWCVRHNAGAENSPTSFKRRCTGLSSDQMEPHRQPLLPIPTPAPIPQHVIEQQPHGSATVLCRGTAPTDPCTAGGATPASVKPGRRLPSRLTAPSPAPVQLPALSLREVCTCLILRDAYKHSHFIMTCIDILHALVAWHRHMLTSTRCRTLHCSAG